ncbi:hypothetical protein K1719_010415 [Acacia pycnantha]|nr:hypothetical protein K1719_010415 [Acacia pycnantha]
MKKWFGDISFSVVLIIIVGKRFDEIEETITTIKALRDFLKLTGEFVISDALLYLRWLDLGGKEKAMKEIAKELDQFLQFWVDEHRDVGSEQAKTEHSDFMDVLLSMADEADMIDCHDADTIIKSPCLLGGTDIAPVTLTWAFSLLFNNPKVLKKAVPELDSEVGREKPAVESDLKNLQYLQAIIKETMRLYPAAPLAAMHETMQGWAVAGYHIPSGTHLLFKDLSCDAFRSCKLLPFLLGGLSFGSSIPPYASYGARECSYFSIFGNWTCLTASPFFLREADK